MGAGPAGICLARELDGLPLRVVLAESGGLGVDPDVQRLSAAESVGLPHNGHTDGRARAFGGAGKLWAGQCLRLDPIDHEARDWVPYSGWPFGPDELAPHYDRAEAFLKVAGQVYDERNYALLGIPAPAWLPDALRTVFTVYTPEVDSGRFHLAALRRSKNVHVLLHANAVEVETGGDAAVATGVRFRTLSGGKATVRARSRSPAEASRTRVCSSCRIGSDRTAWATRTIWWAASSRNTRTPSRPRSRAATRRCSRRCSACITAKDCATSQSSRSARRSSGRNAF